MPPDGTGALVLRLGPGAPGAAASNPTLLTLRIEAVHPTGQSGTTLRTDVTALLNQPITVHLSPGAYKVTSTDGKACATGIQVFTTGTISDDLTYPLAGCQDLGSPSG